MAVGKQLGCQGRRPELAHTPSPAAWWPWYGSQCLPACVAKCSGLFLMKTPGRQGEQDKRGDDPH